MPTLMSFQGMVTNCPGFCKSMATAGVLFTCAGIRVRVYFVSEPRNRALTLPNGRVPPTFASRCDTSVRKIKTRLVNNMQVQRFLKFPDNVASSSSGIKSARTGAGNADNTRVGTRIPEEKYQLPDAGYTRAYHTLHSHPFIVIKAPTLTLAIVVHTGNCTHAVS